MFAPKQRRKSTRTANPMPSGKGASFMPPAFQLKASKTKGAQKELPSIKVKRNNIHLTGEDKYGHFWTEIGPSESYGWWPKNRVGLVDTLFGTEGELNGQTTFGGTPTQDPHHGDAAEESFRVFTDDPAKDESQVKTEIRAFANAYSGEWRWTFGFGQNCRSFQRKLLRDTGLSIKKE